MDKNFKNTDLNYHNKKRITFTIPTWKQIFTRGNFRAFGYLVISGLFINLYDNVSFDYSGNFGYEHFNGDFQTLVIYDMGSIRLGIKQCFEIQQCFFQGLCMIASFLFALLGITSFSFKK